MYKMGEAPTTNTLNILNDAPINIAEIGTSKHALYILSTDNNLYMSGNASTMASNWWAIFMGDYPAGYTGMRCVMNGVKDIKSNINGIAILKTDGTVYYGGNDGLQSLVGQSGGSNLSPSYSPAMNISTTTNNEMA